MVTAAHPPCLPASPPSCHSLAHRLPPPLSPPVPIPIGIPVARDNAAWLRKHFTSPSWEEFRGSGCRTLGVTCGIMTGLLPANGAPVHTGSSSGRARPAAAAAGSSRGSPLQSVQGAVLASLRPVMFINLAFFLAVAGLVWYIQKQHDETNQDS